MEEDSTLQNLPGEELSALVTKPVGDIQPADYPGTLVLEQGEGEGGGRKVQQEMEHDRQVDIEALMTPPQGGDIEA